MSDGCLISKFDWIIRRLKPSRALVDTSVEPAYHDARLGRLALRGHKYRRLNAYSWFSRDIIKIKYKNKQLSILLRF